MRPLDPFGGVFDHPQFGFGFENYYYFQNWRLVRLFRNLCLHDFRDLYRLRGYLWKSWRLLTLERAQLELPWLEEEELEFETWLGHELQRLLQLGFGHHWPARPRLLF